MAHRYCGRRAVRAGAPTSRQVSWEMLAQATATLVSDDGHIRLDAARQEEVTLAAACGARGYLCSCMALPNGLGRSDSE